MGGIAVNLGLAVEFTELFAVLVNGGKAPPADDTVAEDTPTDAAASAVAPSEQP
jgi:hypothetical protein